MPPNQPTLINLPPPPSNPETPSDIPGTPNSATTTMSELSTVAIKDGHRGHLGHHSRQAAPDAERADRISRLAGLERIGAPGSRQVTPGSALAPNSGGGYTSGPAGYFDPVGNVAMNRERSTVGSASATGSVGGHTTWASGSDAYDHDKMSESADMEMDTSSVGGLSDEQNSLVGFGEGARTPARQSAYGSPSVGKATPTGPPPSFGLRETSMTPVGETPRSTDGYSAEGAGVDARRILNERLGGTAKASMPTPDTGKDLGRFDFERQ